MGADEFVQVGFIHPNGYFHAGVRPTAPCRVSCEPVYRRKPTALSASSALPYEGDKP